MELIRAGTPTLVSDSTSRMIHGRWLVANQAVTAQVVPADDIAEGEEDGKWVDEIKRELDEGNYSTSNLRMNNRITKGAECETTFKILANHVYHKQCNRCGGYIVWNLKQIKYIFTYSTSKYWHVSTSSYIRSGNCAAPIQRVQLLGEIFCMSCAAPMSELWNSGRNMIWLIIEIRSMLACVEINFIRNMKVVIVWTRKRKVVKTLLWM